MNMPSRISPPANAGRESQKEDADDIVMAFDPGQCSR